MYLRDTQRPTGVTIGLAGVRFEGRRCEAFEDRLSIKRSIRNLKECSERHYRLRTTLFWVIIQRVVEISYGRFGATYQYPHHCYRFQNGKDFWILI